MPSINSSAGASLLRGALLALTAADLGGGTLWMGWQWLVDAPLWRPALVLVAGLAMAILYVGLRLVERTAREEG
ncbi:MAG: hypothetical protein HYS13_24660 [Planctomycetia bacterium]|nr:hypothetical protein [Planctomycetia bacterium]